MVNLEDLDLVFQITTVLSGTVSYPWDTVLRRMMVDSGRPKHMKQFHSSRHAVETIYRQGGIRAFYKVGDESVFKQLENLNTNL